MTRELENKKNKTVTEAEILQDPSRIGKIKYKLAETKAHLI